MKIGQLDQNLRRFYAEARTKKGEDYSRSTSLGFRHSIERYLNAPPFSWGLQTWTDPRFARSNFMLDAQVQNLKRSGKENVSHKPAIEEEDLQKLKSSKVLSLSSPLSLLRNVWFHVVLFFCRRGLEGKEAWQRTASSLKPMRLEEITQPWVTMDYQRIIPEDLRTLKAQKKKPECMRLKSKVTTRTTLCLISASGGLLPR